MIKYPENSPLEFHDIKEFARKIGGGQMLNDTIVPNHVNDTAIIEQIKRELGPENLLDS